MFAALRNAKRKSLGSVVGMNTYIGKLMMVVNNVACRVDSFFWGCFYSLSQLVYV